MSSLAKVIATVIIGIMSSNVVAKNSPFNQKALLQTKQQYQGERWLMVLWSLDCPACFKELALIQQLQQNNKDKVLKVIFINTDDNDDISLARQKVLAQYQMHQFTNFYFVDGQADHSRYQIDPQWYGELPRSYFIDEQGKSYGKSGLLEQASIKQWLIQPKN